MKITKNIYENHSRTVEPGQVIFKEGERGSELYIIIEGEVEIRKRTSSSTAKTLITFHKGDIFGEMALVEGKPRSATAIAVKPCRMLVINESLLDSMLENNPDFAKKMIRILAERLRKANALIQDLTYTNRQNQVMTGLKQYAQERGISTFKGHRVNMSQFLEWSRSHLGIQDREILSTVQEFLKNGIVEQSALGKGEILVNLNRLAV
jgi:CRP/FNR family cyclic AMP-dependent transcriptional regulator